MAEAPMTVMMFRSASLHVSVVDAAGSPLEGIEVRLVAKGFSLSWPDDVFNSTGNFHWTGYTDETGKCVISELPVQVSLEARLLRDGETLHKIVAPIALCPGDLRETTWAMGRGAVIRGTATYADGRPAVGESLCLVRTVGDAPFEYLRASSEDAYAMTRTREGGAFAFEDVPDGNWLIGPPGVDYDAPNREAFLASLASLTRVVEGESESELTLVLHPGLSIRGVVRDPDGIPSRDGWVRATCMECPGHLTARIENDGRFMIAPVAPGRFRLNAKAGFRSTHADSDPIDAQAGDTKVLLQLGVGCVVRGEIYDPSTGKRGAEELVITGGLDNKVDRTMSGGGFKDGFEIGALRPGDYNIMAFTTNGLAGLLQVSLVDEGQVIEGVQIHLQPGACISIFYNGPNEFAHYEVIRDGVVLVADNIRSGTRVTRTVVPGNLRVVLKQRSLKNAIEKVLRVESGGSAEVVFGP